MRPARPFSESDVCDLERRLRVVTSKAQLQRIQCILLRARQGLNCEQIARVVGWSAGWVRQVWLAFLREGSEGVISKARGGRLRANLTFEREAALVKQFETRARSGALLVVSEIHAAYEREVGHKVPKSTLYRMLARHGWRKVAPRPRHPKNNPEACEAFKKNSPRSSPAYAEGKRRKGGACG